MDLPWSDGELLGAALVAAANLVGQVARSRWRSRRRQLGRGALVEIVPVLPAGSRVEETRPDGTVVRVDLPGQPTTPSEQ